MNELDPLSRSLLAAAARCHEPLEADRARIRRRLIKRLGMGAGLGALGSAVTQTGSAAASTAGSTVAQGSLTGSLFGSVKLFAVGKVVGLTVAASAAGFGGYEWLAPTRPAQIEPVAVSSRAQSPGASVQPVRRLAPRMVAPEQPPVRTAAEPAPGQLRPVPLAPAVRAAEPTGVTAVPASSDSSESMSESRGAPLRNSTLPPVASFPPETPRLAAEARALARAQAALREGDATHALQLLEEQNAQFPEGSLDEERAAARVVALCRAGQVQAANAAAAEFLRRSPHSVLAERVANACPHQK